jgi:glycosyltransferase involved in cell wall biosynthesis
MIRACLPVGDTWGWGVCGRNLLQELTKLTDIGQITDPGLPLLMAVQGANFQPLKYVPSGPRNVGFAFIEQPSEAVKYIETYKTYYTDLICGSQWMAEMMREIGVERTRVVLQGLDSEIFKPSPEPRDLNSPFTVFVGSKAELRKGTDIAIAALAIFLSKHADAQAILAVGNQWPITMHTLANSKWINYQPISDDWRIQIRAVLTGNNISLSQVELPELSTNLMMPDLYRRCDVGLFLSRAEAGTNMVLNEAVACGVMPIASFATGHTDVLRGLAGAQSLCNGKTDGPDGWWEPNDLDDILKYLEMAYQDRQLTRNNGLAAAKSIKNVVRDWPTMAKRILEVLTK